METQDFWAGALVELWWVVVIIGGPALIAVLWENHRKNKERKNAERARQVLAEQGLIERRIADRRSNVKAFVPKQRQTSDDKIFQTVEEYRNGSH